MLSGHFFKKVNMELRVGKGKRKRKAAGGWPELKARKEEEIIL